LSCWRCLAGARISPVSGQGISSEYTLIYEKCEKACRQRQAERATAIRLSLHFVSLLQSGPDANRTLQSDKHSEPSYYPEIAPLSPQFVGTTFYRSHTMMDAERPVGLIASPEARIVDSRGASNRLSEVAQSAARRRIGSPQTTDNEKGAETSVRSLVAGGDRWLDNFVDRGSQNRDVDLTMESLASGLRDPLSGRTSKAGRSGSAKQRRGIRRGVL
jgi:hypothetical protein